MDIERSDHAFKETYPGSDYSSDEQEWLKAIDRAKRVKGSALDCTDLARLLWELGYRRHGTEAAGMSLTSTLSPEAALLAVAVAVYKRKHQRPQPTNTELLAIAIGIGYAKPAKG